MDREYTENWVYAKGGFVDGFINTNQAENGFSVAPGRNANTKGVWFWNKVFVINHPNIEGGKLGIILMDTQGLWDPDTGDNFNYTIFGLSCMLSSYLITNISKNLDAESLASITRYIDFINGLQNGEKPFQHLEFLIRDCIGYKDGEDSYAEFDRLCGEVLNELCNSLAFRDQTDMLKLYFKSIDAACLPFPGNIDARGFSGKIDKIDPGFLMLMGYYIEEIIINAKPFMVDNLYCKLEDLSEYIYCYSIIYSYAIRCGDLLNTMDAPPGNRLLDAFYHMSNERIRLSAVDVLHYNLILLYRSTRV